MKKSIAYRSAVFAVVGLSLSGVTACVSDLGANQYSRGNIGEVSRVDTGVLIASRPIVIEGGTSGIGTAAGAAIGGIAASEIGGSKSDNLLAGAAGALVGSLVGSAAGKRLTKRRGYAYTVRLDKNEEVITVTQGGDVAIPVGTPVLVEYGARTRILPRSGGQPQPYYDQYGRPVSQPYYAPAPQQKTKKP